MSQLMLYLKQVQVIVNIAVASANAVLLIARALRIAENVCPGSARNAMQGNVQHL
jgi:hypothetical protein